MVNPYPGLTHWLMEHNLLRTKTETTVLFDAVFLFYEDRSGFHSSDVATGWNSQLTLYKLLFKGSSLHFWSPRFWLIYLIWVPSCLGETDQSRADLTFFLIFLVKKWILLWHSDTYIPLEFNLPLCFPTLLFYPFPLLVGPFFPEIGNPPFDFKSFLAR